MSDFKQVLGVRAAWKSGNWFDERMRWLWCMAADRAQRILAQLRLDRRHDDGWIAARRQLQKNFPTDQACAIVK
jgi:hypothetical protein